jgi:beta-phosphoglucomutase-like phosphatase (HAD superfamily)
VAELLLLFDVDGTPLQSRDPLLSTAMAHQRLAVVTGNPEGVAHLRLERLGLARFFPDGQGPRSRRRAR